MTGNRRTLCMGLALAGLVASARAQQPVGDPIVVNTGTAGKPARTDVGLDSAGNFVVVWAGTEGGPYLVFGRRYDAAGQPVGTPFPISNAAGTDPVVATADTGEFLVVWEGSAPSGAPRPIRGRWYDATGAAGPEFEVNASTAIGSAPRIAVDPRGGFLVVWQDNAPGDTNVFARRFDALGMPTGAEFRVNAAITGSQGRPTAGVDGAGNFVVAWAGSPASFRRFDATGTPQGGDVAIDTWSSLPAVAVAPDGEFLVAWTGYDVFGRAFDASGTPRGPRFVVGPDFDHYYSFDDEPSVVTERGGGGTFLVAWQAGTLDDEWMVDFRASGKMVGHGQVVSRTFVASPVQGWPHYTSPRAAMNAAGQFVTVWSDPGSWYDGSLGSGRVFARRFSVTRVSGVVTDAVSGLPLSGATVAIQGEPNMTSDPGGRYQRVLAPGTYNVMVTLRNYVTATASVDVQPGVANVRDFALVPLPELQAGGYTFDESGPGGNANGVLDANERFLLTLDVRNIGPGAATGVSAAVSSPTSGVTVVQPNATYPDIASGGQAANPAAFELVIPTTHPLGTPIRVDLAVATDQGPATLQYSIPTGRTRRASFAVVGPFEVPDRGATIQVPIPVSGIVGPIANVELTLHATHPVPSDLRISLFGPGPVYASVRLVYGFPVPATGSNLGTDCPADSNDTTFTDAAPQYIHEGTAPYVGRFRPSEFLFAQFNGKSDAGVNGNWRLEVFDWWAVPGQASAGRLECANLTFDTYVPASGGHQEVAIAGTVTDAFTGAPLAGATVSASGFSTVSGTDGGYVLDVLPGTFDLVAEAPGYRPGGPTGVTVSSGTVTANIALAPVLVDVSATVIDDQAVGGNGNGRVDVNERFRLQVTLANAGAADLTAVSGVLSTTMPGVVVTQGQSTYPDIPAGGTGANVTEFELQTAPDFAAGQRLDLRLAVATAQGLVAVPLELETGTALDTPIVVAASGPLPILRSGVNPPATLAFTFSGMTSPVAKVVAQVHVKNPEARRVALWLDGPDATRVTLSNTRPGFPGIGADFGTDCPADANDTTFDDAAALYIGAAPIGRVGSFRPDQPLARFLGKEANGVWKLSAIHNASTQAYGTLECARLLVYGSVTGDAVPLSDRLFWDGFETGDLSAWSGVSNASGDLKVTAAGALAATVRGLAALVNDTEPLYVRDETPAGEPRYRTRFHFDPNGFDPGESAGRFRAIVFMALDESPQKRVVQLILRRLGGVYSLRARITLDDGTRAETPFVPITDAAHVIEFDWEKATAPGAADGSFQLWIDGVAAPALAGLANHDFAVDYARLGAMVLKPGASGTMYFDRFESRRTTYIGP